MMIRFFSLCFLFFSSSLIFAQSKLPGNFISIRTELNYSQASNSRELLRKTFMPGYAVSFLYLEEHERTGLDCGVSYAKRFVLLEDRGKLEFNQIGLGGRFRRYWSTRRNVGLQLGYLVNFDLTSVQNKIDRVTNGPEVGFVLNYSRLLAFEATVFMPVNDFGQRHWNTEGADGVVIDNSEGLFLVSVSVSVRVNLYELF